MSHIPAQKIRTSPFYGEWKGHPLEDLKTFHSHLLSTNPSKSIIYLAGDSSLDNKAWVPSSGPGGQPTPVEPPGIYKDLFDPPLPTPDIAFWLNHLVGDLATCLNCAVEESMLRERDSALLPHDKFIRDHMRDQDILIVSVGANDIALRPLLSTILSMLALAWLTPECLVRWGWAPPLRYFQRLFRDKIQAYVQRLVEKCRPTVVVVCMIYFPLEAKKGQKGWADLPLKMLGYDIWPNRLQTAIRKLYDISTNRVRVDGIEIVPCALYNALDGKRADDYVARAEPSVEGGRKLSLYLETILRPLYKR